MVDDDDEDDEKAIPKTASGGRGQKLGRIKGWAKLYK